MNREVKFRVWTGERMDYSVGVCNFGAFYCGGIDPNDSACLGNTTLYSKDYPVMQYTGLNDCQGKEIFEGDILSSLVNNESQTQLGICKEVLGGWKIFSSPNPLVHWQGWRRIVVGNVYENPGLLK
jgi:uncharacterized phage protein (TIGR01671 family)